MTFEEGIRLDLSESDYHSDPCDTPSLSSSVANTLLTRSPLHAFHEHPKLGGHRREPTKSMDDGSIVHSLLLGKGARFARLDHADYRKKAAQEDRDAAEAAGYIPVLADHLGELHVATETIRRKLGDRGILLDGESEVSLFWKEESIAGPVLCRGRIDHLRRAQAQAWDLKSARSAHPRAVDSHIAEYGYAVQRAAYVSALGKLIPELLGRVDFRLVFFELFPPYCVTPVRLSGEFRHLGETRWGRAINQWGVCLRDNHWPEYVEVGEEHIATPPRWAMNDEFGDVA